MNRLDSRSDSSHTDDTDAVAVESERGSGRRWWDVQLVDVLVSLGLFVVVLVVYVRTMTPGLGGGIDSAELQHAAHELSIVHPTGYPLYLLLARAFIWIVPFGAVAWRVTLLSALFAATAVVLVQAIVATVSGRRLAGLLAAALAATHPLIWGQATIAEVNSLNLLLVAAFIYALVRWANWTEGQWRPPLELAGLLFGLALANHRVSLLALPAIVLFIVWSVREGARVSLPSVARTLGAVLLPLLLYVYMPLRAGTTDWYSNSWDGFWHQVTGDSAWPVIRETLRHPLTPRVRIVFEALFGQRSLTTFQEGQLSSLFQLSGLGLLALTAGNWRHDGLWRRVVLGLLAPATLTVAAVMVVYDVDVIGDYLSMAALLVAIMAGLGVAALFDEVRSSTRLALLSRTPATQMATTGVWLLLLGALIWHGMTIHPRMDRSGDDSAQVFWEDVRGWEGTAEALEPGALLIGPWHRHNELRYLQAVDGWRRDLQTVVLDDIVSGNRLELIDEWLAQGRAIYLLEATPSVLDHFLADRHGSMWHITERGQTQAASMEHPLNVRFGADVTLLGYTLQPERAQPGEAVRITLFWRAEAPIEERYVIFAHLRDAAGQMVTQRDDEPGRGQRPTIGWTPGETVSEALLLALDPATPPGSYSLVVGLYTRIGEQRLPVTGAGGEQLGDYWQMAEVEVGP